MAIAPVNKFLSVAVPVTPGEQKLYEVPTGTSAILLYAQVSNVGIGQSYPTVTFIHRRETRSTGITRDIRIIKDIEIPPNDAAILVDGRLVLEKTATTLDRLYIKGVQTGITTITNVTYSPYSGIATVTTMDAHGFSVNDQISMVGIAFTCSSNAGITTTIFPDPQQSSTVESIVDAVGTSKTFTSVIGGTGILNVDHYYNPSPHHFVKASNNAFITGGDYTHTFKTGLTTSVGAVVMGGEYTHNWISAATGAVNIESGGSGQLTPNNSSTYNPTTGILTLKFDGNHGLTGNGTSGAKISLDNNSLTLTCAMDNHHSQHTYPRVGDPIAGVSTFITRVDDNTLTIYVGSAKTTNHTPSAATYNAGTGELVLTIPSGYPINRPFTANKSAEASNPSPTTYNPLTGDLVVKCTNHGLEKGRYVRFVDGSFKFKCAKDSNVGVHAYPRATDPESRKWIPIKTVGDANHFTVGISTAGPDGQHAHTIDSISSNNIEIASDSIKIGDNSLVFTCAMDNNATEHSYPRAGIDTASNWQISIGSTTQDVPQSGGTSTISLFVGKSPIKNFNPVSADYDGDTGDMRVVLGTGHNLRGQTLHTPTAATYVPTTGLLTLTINAHGMRLGDKIRIQDQSLIFTCNKDLRRTQHKYPRSTDPKSGKWLPVIVVNANQIRVDVGASSDTSTHFFESALSKCIAKQGESIKLKNSGYTFTCAMDDNSSEHAYPRSSDPYYNTAVGIGTTTSDSVTVHVGKSPSGGLVGPLQMEFIGSILENSST